MQRCEGAVPAAPHPQERQRLATLHALVPRMAHSEQRFNNITALAAQTFDVPIVLITLVDETQQWFKSHHGLALNTTPRDWSFCAHALHSSQLMVIEDSWQDPRFATNPLVRGDPHIRFYAGALIRSSCGLPLGTLCLIDSRPRSLSPQQRRLLIEFARFAERELCRHAAAAHERTEADIRTDIDPLTQFSTQRGFDKITNTLLALPGTGQTVTLVLIELRDFERLKRRQGLTVAKLFLLEIAKRLEAVALKHVILKARLESGTFGLLCMLPRLQLLQELLDKIAEQIRAPIIIDGRFQACEMRIMWIENCAHFESANHLLLACNHVSQLPSSQTTKYLQVDSDAHLAQLQRIIAIHKRFPDALANDGLTLHYQPKVHLQSHAITGLEALLRWHDTDMGYVSPPEMLAIAEELGLSQRLDNWVIRKAIAQLAAWRAAGIPLTPLAINLTQEQLVQPDFAMWVECLLKEYDVSPHLIEFEIVEHVLVRDFEAIIANMDYLKKQGISFAIDDFGTGYSSLSYLNRLPADTLKIDRSFIIGIHDDAKATSLVRAIIDLGHNAGMRIVAEGVETRGQYLMLHDCQCDEVQGYYFSHPLPADKIISLLASNAPFAHLISERTASQ